jgi:hypothetical protein
MSEQERLAKATKNVANALADMLEAWIDAEGCDAHGHPTDIPGYPFQGSLEDVSADMYAFAVRTGAWAAAVERRAQEKGDA